MHHGEWTGCAKGLPATLSAGDAGAQPPSAQLLPHPVPLTFPGSPLQRMWTDRFQRPVHTSPTNPGPNRCVRMGISFEFVAEWLAGSAQWLRWVCGAMLTIQEAGTSSLGGQTQR